MSTEQSSSTRTDSEPTLDDQAAAFRDTVREEFAAWTKSRQAAAQRDDVRSGPQYDRHNDGEALYQQFSLELFGDYLRKAAREDHAVAQHPQALPHLVTHLEDWERRELKATDPDLEDLPRTRRTVLKWFAADEDRMQRMRTGGTDLLAHGEQGTTKTTMLHWLVALIMQINPRENVIWQSTLDDTEWTTLAPFATVALPAGVDVAIEADPYRHNDGENVPLSIEDISRDVIRYNDPEDLAATLANRVEGQFYVVYPDPQFRGCESTTGWPYDSIYDVDETTAATDLSHWWFALLEELVHGPEYNEWTTIVADEAQKFLSSGASNSEHEWWNKIKDWATTYGDARKHRLSVFLSVHRWSEVHDMVWKKMRWGATMNGEPYPSKAPLDGRNDRQGLGETCIWSSQKWNHVGYPDMKRYSGVPADIHVSYPRWEEVKHDKS